MVNNSHEKSQLNVGIITFPIMDAGVTPLSNLVQILGFLSSDICLITGNAGYAFFKENKKIHTHGVEHRKGTNVFTRIINYTSTQVKICCNMVRTARNVDFYVFFIGGESLLLPLLTAKLLRKKIVLVLAASPGKSAEARKDPLFKLLGILARTGLILSNRIIVYAENIIREPGLGKYRSKVSVAPRHFIDFNSFKTKKKIEKRKNSVGYIGRLSEEKAVFNFVESIPIVLKMRRDVKFLIGGDGNLLITIRGYLKRKNLMGKVKMAGWIPHDELPKYLNELKLLVLPSCTEGLPNVMLEAMACGTPVLATAVGGIPDVIRNGHTGLLMKDNSPQCIANSILKALNYHGLERIAENAVSLIHRKFTLEAAVKRYQKVLNKLKLW